MASGYEKRDKRKTAALEKSAAADKRAAAAAERSARADEHRAAAAAHEASANAHAALQVASAQADALDREARAKEHLAKKQGEAAVASAVGHLSAEGVGRIDNYEKLKEDRENIQQLFDEIGNCIACIENGGKATEHFDEDPFDDDGRYKSDRVSHAYRYANLYAARAKLIDLREEINRVRIWDANQSREVTLERIAEYLKDAKQEATRQAGKCINLMKEREAKFKKNCLMLAIPTAGMSLLCLMCGAESWSKEYDRPTCWQDMVDEAE